MLLYFPSNIVPSFPVWSNLSNLLPKLSRIWLTSGSEIDAAIFARKCHRQTSPRFPDNVRLPPENTPLLFNAKYQFTYLRLTSCFTWIQLLCFSWPNPNQSNWRTSEQWYLPFESKWVFSTTSLLPCDSNFYPSLSRLGSRGSLQIWQEKKFFAQYLVHPHTDTAPVL